MSLFLGIELGSTRIKAVVIDETGRQQASGAFDWENRLEDGIWTYHLDDAWEGVRESFACLASDYLDKHKTQLPEIACIGISAMMHGYLVLDKNDKQLAQFRTWRNTITEDSAKLLTEAFGFNIPQRWSIAHLHRAVSIRESHVNEINYLTTLGGYIHYKLTGCKVVGIGEASGIIPVDSVKKSYADNMLRCFDELISEYNVPWKLCDILPKVINAGEDAGCLTIDGAALLDPAGNYLKPGIPLCPPEGDAGTGMVATNAVTPQTGNISAGTSVFAMLVLDKALKKVHPQIDMVTTPTGHPVAMVHCNNCTSDLDAWIGLFSETLTMIGAASIDKTELYRTLYNAALGGSSDAGGLLSVNYLSGEHVTGIDDGRPLFLRMPESKFNISNFMRCLLFSAIATFKIGMDILTKEEGITVSKLLGHGGLFKIQGVAQKLMAGALNIPIALMDTAGEGGAWGMALLAAYRILKEQGETLEAFLEKKIFAGSDISVIEPDPADVKGFDNYLSRYKDLLKVERTASIEVI